MNPWEFELMPLRYSWVRHVINGGLYTQYTFQNYHHLLYTHHPYLDDCLIQLMWVIMFSSMSVCLFAYRSISLSAWFVWLAVCYDFNSKHICFFLSCFFSIFMYYINSQAENILAQIGLNLIVCQHFEYRFHVYYRPSCVCFCLKS